MKRGRSSHWIAFVMAFALVVALGVAVVLVRGVYLQRDQQEVMKEAAEPVGDEESDQYDWTGSYMDTMYLETTIAIESGLGGVYNVSITWGEQDSDDMSFWNCKASY
ncbi:MAG: hypothetical protein IJV04_06430, partial [Lachnospiraceae bacterium]|nr:hypothetical protein [Lachnospiraceae bacterium]